MQVLHPVCSHDVRFFSPVVKHLQRQQQYLLILFLLPFSSPMTSRPEWLYEDVVKNSVSLHGSFPPSSVFSWAVHKNETH